MRPISGFIVAMLAVLALAGCSTRAADNTPSARPSVAVGGVRLPRNSATACAKNKRRPVMTGPASVSGPRF